MDAQTRAPADLGTRLYYAGFTVFTLGIGDYVPGNDFWRVTTAIGTLHGLVLVTLGITYLLNVVGAVVARRQTATRIAALGYTAAEIVDQGWTGSEFSSAFVEHLRRAGGLHQRARRAAPRLPRCCGTPTQPPPAASAPVRLATLDDALRS